jgi:hypothetical protein
VSPQDQTSENAEHRIKIVQWFKEMTGESDQFQPCFLMDESRCCDVSGGQFAVTGIGEPCPQMAFDRHFTFETTASYRLTSDRTASADGDSTFSTFCA